MSNSRLKSAAERLLIVGNTLNDPRDIAVAHKYVAELEKLAAREVIPPPVAPDAPPHEMRAAVIGSTLRKAFPPDPAPRFKALLDALD